MVKSFWINHSSSLIIALILWMGVCMAWLIPMARSATNLHPFNYTGTYQTCLWCGRKLPKDQPFFDIQACGYQWAEQMASRGYRVHKEEIVDVRGGAP